LLGRSVHAFWGTSYSFDLRLFDQYLLRRVAQNSLNAVVLVDHDKLASLWEHLQEGETYLVKQAGRRYLLRGVLPHGGGAFHPKTYLFARADHATLLIGSGNLTRGGIDHGHEVFTAFTTEREGHMPSLRAWAHWVGQLVRMQGDELLSERWVALRQACPWMVGSLDGSELLTNEQRSLGDQLIERLPNPVSELHVSAPFFDRDAVALRHLLRACSPRRVILYVGADVSVHGPSLRAALAGAHEVQVRVFQPRVFVHAKLIGAIGADGRGILVAGSPNLSQAALIRSYVEAGGNCEVAVVRSGTAEELRTVFESSGLDLVDASLDSVVDLEFRHDTPTLPRQLVLRSAQWRADGRVQLDWGPEPDELPKSVRLDWGEVAAVADIASDGATVDPLADREPTPLLVKLIDAAGHPVSNQVVIDDPAALREALVGSSGRQTSRPSEMEGMDMVPLVRLVLWAHEKFIFDPDETAAFRRAHEAAAEDASAEDATEFWERYATEELQYDPRAQAYKPLTATGAAVLPVDELLRELQLLLHAAPRTTSEHVLRVLTEGTDTGDGTGTGAPWSMEARQRVRAYNLLARWTAAVADPRHALIAPHAPVVNYETLLSVIFLAWANEALEIAQLRRLLRTLLDAFIGPAEGHGFLGRVNQTDRAAALRHLDPGFVDIGTGLAYVALTGPHWREDIYDWQPTLQRGVELGVILPGPLSESVVLHLTGHSVDEKTIDEVLSHRLDWVDDPTWCRRLAIELALPSVSLEPFNNPKVPMIARLRGALDFLHDSRVLTVARRVAKFKHLSAIAVQVGDDRFIFEPGTYARALIGGPGGSSYKTDDPVDATKLEEIEDQGGTLADLLGLGSGHAAAA
jgi:hypothetical protein